MLSRKTFVSKLTNIYIYIYYFARGRSFKETFIALATYLVLKRYKYILMKSKTANIWHYCICIISFWFSLKWMQLHLLVPTGGFKSSRPNRAYNMSVNSTIITSGNGLWHVLETLGNLVHHSYGHLILTSTRDRCLQLHYMPTYQMWEMYTNRKLKWWR